MTVRTIDRFTDHIVVRLDDPGHPSIELHYDGKHRRYLYEGWGLKVPAEQHDAIDDVVRAYLQTLNRK